MANEQKDVKGDPEVDLMDELLDQAEDFDELTESEDKRRRKAGEIINGNKVKILNVKSEAARDLRRESRNSKLKRSKESRTKTKNMDGGIKKENEAEFDTRSEASSDHEDEPSMSDGSKNSSVSRDSSVERDLDEIDLKRKRSESESSMKSVEGGNNIPVKIETEEKTAPKKKYDYATKINYMFRETRFFLMKSNNFENIEISMTKGVWSTPPQNESKLNQAFRESRNVVLIYSVKESGKFCGFCRLSSESRRDLPFVGWLLPPGLPARALGGIFQVDWISKKELSFIKTQHLYNPWNEGKPVKIGKDGQEIEPRVAEELCRLIPKDESINLTPILHKSKKSAKERRIRGPLRRPIMVPGERRGGGRGGGMFRERGGGAPFRDRGRGMRMDHLAVLCCSQKLVVNLVVHCYQWCNQASESIRNTQKIELFSRLKNAMKLKSK